MILYTIYIYIYIYVCVCVCVCTESFEKCIHTLIYYKKKM